MVLENGTNPTLSIKSFLKSITNSSGCSVARLSRLVWDQEVASSNLAIPTKKSPARKCGTFFLKPLINTSAAVGMAADI